MRFAPTRTERFSADELYLFDTMGYLRIPGFVSPHVVTDCRQEVMTMPSGFMTGRGDKERFNDIVQRSADFAEMASGDAMLACVEPVINQPLRLIESYALRRVGDSVFYLHNGNSEIVEYAGSSVGRNMSFSHTFHDGKLFCMFIKVLVYLTDVLAPEDGPFCYLQGSHKANFPRFPDAKAERPALTTENFSSLRQVPVRAGDALILNEALLHGTLPKSTPGERLLLAFSYAPAFVADWNEIDKDSADIAKVGHF